MPRHLRRALDRVGVLQIDSVNVLVRSHELPLFARLGPLPALVVDRPRRAAARAVRVLGARGVVRPGRAPPAAAMADGGGRDAGVGRHGTSAARAARLSSTTVLAEVAQRGPHRRLRARRRRRRSGARGGAGRRASRPSSTCSGRARLASAGRGPNFERRYDLTERVLPAGGAWTPDADRGRRQPRAAPARAAKHLGVGTVRDLADYFRIKLTDCPAAVGRARGGRRARCRCRSRGWKEIAYLHPEAAPAAPDRRARVAVAVRLADLGAARAPSASSA